MTLNEFLKRLAKTPRSWDLNSAGAIRCPAEGRTDINHCPISAVTGDVDDMRHAIKAATEKLKITKEDAQQVMDAADNLPGDNATIRQFRALMLVACGICT